MAVKVAEVIELDSDDEVPSSSKKKSQNKPKTCNTNCVNFGCTSGINMMPASAYVCAYYGVNMKKKKKKRSICKACLDDALSHQDHLINALVERKPLLQCEFPDHSMEVEISDSDESDGESKADGTGSQQDVLISEEVIEDFKKKVDISLKEVIKKYDVDYQVSEAHKALKSQWSEIDESNKQLDDDISKAMSKLDSLRAFLYNDFKPQIQMQKELVIRDVPERFVSPQISITSRNVSKDRNILIPNSPERALPQRGTNVATKKVTRSFQKPSPVIQAVQASQQDSQPEILEEIGRFHRVSDLPPYGNLVKTLPQIDDYVFTMNRDPLYPWIKGKVIEVNPNKPFPYKVKLLPKKHSHNIKSYSGKQLAHSSPCAVIIPVGSRVVAMFEDTYSVVNYYSGVIAEPPKSTNKYRYLVFFDDGYAQYVKHKHIYLVFETATRVWEDIPSESRDFVKKYLETYPERPMVKLQVGQVVKTEWNGKWWIARVAQLDASLVQMHFDADNRTEWIYRGSARLGPLYVEFMKANMRQQGKHSSANNAQGRHRIQNNKNGPYVEYTWNNAEETATPKNKPVQNTQIQNTSQGTVASVQPAQQSRAVAKKSTAKKTAVVEQPPVSSYGSNINNSGMNSMETKSSHSIVYYQTQNKIQTKKYVPHRCGPKCVESISFTPDDLRGYSPLSIPLLCGWNRQLCKFAKGKKVILYQAPCGVRLRNMFELHKYLRTTKCPMSVDLFEFDYWVHCLAEFVLDKCFVNIKDLSYGVENVPIPCVNEIDHAYPDTIKYTTKREPADDVKLNLDPGFLCSCDCEDDCQDKEKCQCWQLTIKGATLGGRVPNAAVGYVYKRLPEAVSTGIYECNAGCKCSVKTCINRVVQHPLNLKLQVFKTAPRGWGIRCLNDIPLGSFICIYAGRLLTEQGANEGGKNYGDEYLAELDYVEVVEGIKEGYEEDVLDPELPLNSLDIEDDDEDKKSSEDDLQRDTGNNDSDDDFSVVVTKKTSFDQNQVIIIDDEDSRSSIRTRLRKRKKDENKSTDNTEDVNTSKDKAGSDDEENIREPSRLDVNIESKSVEGATAKSVRDYFGEDEAVYIMDAKTTGNIGRYLNHSCDPNVFVQNVFVDTHDVRFPWVAFFALSYIRAGQELTWNYSYDVGSIPGKVIICKCGSINCRGRLL